MYRRELFRFAAPAIIVGVAVIPKPALAITPHNLWVTGGEDASGWSHDDALARMVADGYLPIEAGRDFSLLANARGGEGRSYSLDPLEEGQAFGCMCFGGKRSGSQKRMLKNVIAKPSSFKAGVSKEMRTWTWSRVIDGKRVTVGYAVPLVCGNSSAIAYLKGAPVCVPIPQVPHSTPRV